MRRSRAEIDLNQIKQNYLIYREHISRDQKVMAVVKNAYSHGDVQTAKVLSELGVTDFAVSNISEAMKLRNSGITGQILIIGYIPVE